MTSYPSSIWSPTSKTDGVDYPQASHINDLQNEVVAIETAIKANFGGTPTTGDLLYYDGTKWTALTPTYITASSTTTLTNKRITKRVASTTNSATAAIDGDSYDEYYLTAVANNTTFSVTGTPTTGQEIFIGFKDAGVSKTLTWTSITALGVTLPTATTAGKQHIVKIKYISSAWRAIAVAVEA